jgi:hypothetical protein
MVQWINGFKHTYMCMCMYMSKYTYYSDEHTEEVLLLGPRGILLTSKYERIKKFQVK